MKKLNTKLLFAGSVACYIVSLCVPAFYDSRSNDGGRWIGLSALLAGIFGLLAGGVYVCWLANPLILIVWIAACLKKRLMVIRGSIAAFLLCLSFFLNHTVIIDEAGNEGVIVCRSLGFWLWLLTPLLMLFYGLLLRKKEMEP